MKLFLFLFSIVFTSENYAAHLKVAFGENRPPYVFEQGSTLSGIEIDIIKEALLLGGYTIESISLPTRRLSLAITKMDYDVAVGLIEETPLLYSSVYMEVKNYAVSQSNKGINLSKIEDLSKYTVGAWPGAWNFCGEEFKKMFAPDSKGNFAVNYIEPPNSETQSKMFWRGRFEIAITNKVTFQFYQKALSKTLNTESNVIYHDLIDKNISLRANFKNEKVRDAFENGLSQLRRNKRYQRIFQYYISKV